VLKDNALRVLNRRSKGAGISQYPPHEQFKRQFMANTKEIREEIEACENGGFP
jgi:hypothetical protein